VVYGYDEEDKSKHYAVKILDKFKLQQNQRNLTNLTNEICLMSVIRSKNVVALHNATKTTKNYYLAMELCNGKDLEKYVELRGGYLPESEARIILCQIIEGMKAIKD